MCCRSSVWHQPLHPRPVSPAPKATAQGRLLQGWIHHHRVSHLQARLQSRQGVGQAEAQGQQAQQAALEGAATVSSCHVTVAAMRLVVLPCSEVTWEESGAPTCRWDWKAVRRWARLRRRAIRRSRLPWGGPRGGAAALSSCQATSRAMRPRRRRSSICHRESYLPRICMAWHASADVHVCLLPRAWLCQPARGLRLSVAILLRCKLGGQRWELCLTRRNSASQLTGCQV